MKSFFIRLLLAAVLVSSAAKAEVTKWQIVPNESRLTFTAVQNNAPVTGQFKKFSGAIEFDPEQLAQSKVEIDVDMNSVSASYGEVESTLKTPEWFNVSAFPQAVFKAAEFVKTGNNSYEANGTLTIRDKTIPVKLIFTMAEYSKTKARAQGSVVLKRTQFGVGQGEWAKTDAVGDDVKVEFVVVVKV